MHTAAECEGVVQACRCRDSRWQWGELSNTHWSAAEGVCAFGLWNKEVRYSLHTLKGVVSFSQPLSAWMREQHDLDRISYYNAIVLLCFHLFRERQRTESRIRSDNGRTFLKHSHSRELLQPALHLNPFILLSRKYLQLSHFFWSLCDDCTLISFPLFRIWFSPLNPSPLIHFPSNVVPTNHFTDAAVDTISPRVQRESCIACSPSIHGEPHRCRRCSVIGHSNALVPQCALHRGSRIQLSGTSLSHRYILFLPWYGLFA